MNRKRRLKIQDFNRHLICILCGGYFIDATTIIECLHSFCRACIVQYLEHNRFCPVCDVQVHKSKPLQNIRHDRILQDLVYKLVPGLFQKEMRCREEFLSRHQAGSTTSALLPPTDQSVTPFYAPDECFSITLEYWQPLSSNLQDVAISCAEPLVSKKRYLRCPAAVTVAHLGHLLLAKHGLNAEHAIQFVHKEEPLHDHLMLMDIAYIFKWRRVGPLKLSYRIFENDAKRIKLESSNWSNDPCVQATDPCLLESGHVMNMNVVENTDLKAEISDWKEVQLQISETGIMSVSGISVEHKKKVLEPTEPVGVLCPTNEPPPVVHAIVTTTVPTQLKFVNDHVPPVEETPATDIAKLNVEGLAPLCAVQGSCDNSNSSLSKVKDMKPSPHMKQRESLDLASKLGPPKVQKIVSGSVSKETIGSSLTGTGLNSIKSNKVVLKQDYAALTEKKSQMAKNTLSSAVNPQTTKKSSNSNSMGYKTLKVPPKTWNPSITRSSYLNSQKHVSNSDSPENSKASLSSVNNSEKAPKFFKMRNMPRYLGNPASGVKPMYQVVSDTKAQESVARNKQTVIKIDPKTLSPIVSVVSVSSSAVAESSVNPSTAFYSSGQMVGSETKSVSSELFSTCVRNVLKQSPYKSAPSPPYRNSTTTSKALSNSSISSNLSKNSATTVSSNSATSNDLSSPHGTCPKNIRVHTQQSFAFNTATLNLLSSNLSFLPNTSNFLYGNFSNFGSPLLRPGLNLSTGIPPAEGNSCPNLGIATNNLAQGLGAFHSMPPSINMLFPHMRTGDRSNMNHPHTPAVQRIPASKGTASMSSACAKSNSKSSQIQGVTCTKIGSHLTTRRISTINDNSAGELHPDDGSKPKLCAHPQKLDSHNTDIVPMKANARYEMCEQKKETCKKEHKWTSEGPSIEHEEMRPCPAATRDLEATVNPGNEKMVFNSVFHTSVKESEKVEPGLLMDVVKVEKVKSTEDKQASENAAQIASVVAEKLILENAGAGLTRKTEAMVGEPAIDRVRKINRESETVGVHVQRESTIEAPSANASNDTGLTELVLVTKSKVISAEESSMARDIAPSSRANNNSNTKGEVCTNVLMSSTAEDETSDNVAGIDRASDVKMGT